MTGGKMKARGDGLFVRIEREMRLRSLLLVGGGVDFGSGLSFAHFQFLELVGLDIVRAVLCQDAHPRGELDEVVGFDDAFAVRRLDLAAHLGHLLEHLAVIGVFVFQAAQQPAAHSADFLRVERKPLYLCHLYGHLFEIGQVSGAATRSAAHRKRAAHLGVVALVYLAQLDSHAEYGRQRAHQVPEIDPPVRREVEDELGAVEGVFRVDELHVEPELRRLFAYGGERGGAVVEVALELRVVLGSGFAHHGLQGTDDLLFGHIAVGNCDGCVLKPPRGFHDDAVALLELDVLRVEVVDLVGVPELYADYDCHLCLTSSSENSSASVTAVVLTPK